MVFASDLGTLTRIRRIASAGPLLSRHMKTKELLLPSGRRNPCPVCGRTTDGDCRIGDDIVLCHRGKTAAPPEALAIGEVINGWAYTGETSDGRCSVFTSDQSPVALKLGPAVQDRQEGRGKPTKISLAWLPRATAEPPPHLPDGQRLTYGLISGSTSMANASSRITGMKKGRFIATQGQGLASLPTPGCDRSRA